MKTIKKIAAIMMAAMLTIVMGITAFAAPTTKYSITITNDKTTSNVTIVGQEYSAYKIFDVDYAEDSTGNATGPHHYTVDKDFNDFIYSDDKGNKYQDQELIEYVSKLNNDSAKLDDFAKQAYKHISTKKILADGTGTAATETVTIPVSEPGYYLVYGKGTAPDNKEVVAACALDTTNPTANVNVKIQAPTIDKVIVNADSANGKGTAVNVGDRVEFKVTSKVPNMKGYTKYDYIVHDTMSDGLTFDKTSVNVTINGIKLEDPDYTLDIDTVNSNKFSISMDLKALETANKAQAGDPIVITYSATLNEKALITKEETNTVNLEYSNDPNSDTKVKTPDTKVYVFDFDIVVDKYDADKTSKKLSGAEFVLYKKTASDTKEYYKLDGKKVTWVLDEASATLVTTDNNGAVSFTGLDAGTYFLHEKKAPDGYNPLKTDIKVVITANYNEDGTLLSSTATATYSSDPSDVKDLVNKAGTDQIDYTVPVPNTTGIELPSTGGIGTNIFYIVGGLLMAGAVVLLVTRKKMS